MRQHTLVRVVVESIGPVIWSNTHGKTRINAIRNSKRGSYGMLSNMPPVAVPTTAEWGSALMLHLPGMDSGVPRSAVQTVYAGFWFRAAAYLVDGALLWVGSSSFYAFLTGLTGGDGDDLPTALPLWAFRAIVSWPYDALLESSTWQATIGKRLLNIRVTDEHGGRIGFGRATGRHFGKYISSIILGIGYVLAAFTGRKQALHDLMARCLVLRTPRVPPPEIRVSSPPPPTDPFDLSAPRQTGR